MRTSGVWGTWLVAVVVAGCGPVKELPDEVPRPEEPTAPAEADEIPERSEPAAREAAERAVRAITGGNPARLARLRYAVLSYRGSVVLPTSPLPAAATLRWEIAWPDRARATYDIAAAVRQTFYLRGNLGWRSEVTAAGDERPGELNPRDVGRIISTELIAQPGVMLGLTLADANAILFDARRQGDATSFRLKLSEAPVLTITCDAATNLPTRVEYQPREFGRLVHKLLVMTDHQPADGLMLPTKLEFSQNHRLGEEWKLDKWEFPETIDDSRFGPPRP